MTGIAQGSADGPKKIFGRENVNWQGPQRANAASEKHAATNSASDDFTYSNQNPEYVEAIHQAFIDEEGAKGVKEDVISMAMMKHIIGTGGAYCKEELDVLYDRYEKHFNNFAKTVDGMDVISRDLESGLNEGYGLIDMENSTDIDVLIDEEEKNRFLNDKKLDNTHNSFEEYVAMVEGEKQLEEAFASLVTKIKDIMPDDDDDDFERQIEEARLQDANDRGYDTIEDYEQALDDAQFEYADGRGFEVARDQASSAALKDYFNSNTYPTDPSEAESISNHYRNLFDQYYYEGTNSETVNFATLSTNSSYEVVDVRDGELVVDDSQEAEWASSFEFDHLREDFTSYARKHPYKE